MKTVKLFYLGIFVFSLLSSCQTQNNKFEILVKNDLDFDRSNETVLIPYSDFEFSEEVDLNLYGLVDKVSGEKVLCQHIDSDTDGQIDAIIFQPAIKANSEKTFNLVKTAKPEITDSKVFSRFVPERTDDFAWENDKVAFRTYGPTAQKMVEDGTPGGTLSSGLDCWLKRVDYPIINKWYKKYSSGEGTYHEDTGEGLDNFHVGSSRGCGGLGVFDDNEFYTSANFTDWKVLSNGPLRTSFTLNYADWQADKVSVKETKKISLDLGSNLMKIDAEIAGPDVITVGLTLHENEGEVSVDTVNGWFSYWQPLDDSELGTAIVCNPKDFLGYKHLVSEERDKSHLLVYLKVNDGKAVYYTGFGWKKSGQFSNNAEWEVYLTDFAKALAAPLKIEIKKL
jgi:hypothetical protein